MLRAYNKQTGEQVGEGLKQAERANDVGPTPDLHRRPDLAVSQQDIGNCDQEHDQQQDAFGTNVVFVGLDNFRALFRDETYLASFRVTAVFSLLVAGLEGLRDRICGSLLRGDFGGGGRDVGGLATATNL